MAEHKLVQLKIKNNSYAKHWPHCDIRSCCHQSLYAFTSRYDSTLLGRIFLYQKAFLHEIFIYHSVYVCPFTTHKFRVTQLSKLKTQRPGYLQNTFSREIWQTTKNYSSKIIGCSFICICNELA